MESGKTGFSPLIRPLTLLCLLLCTALGNAACNNKGREGRKLLNAMLEAHGGSEALESMGPLFITGSTDFKHRLIAENQLRYHGFQRWEFELRGEEGGRMVLGGDEGKCWTLAQGSPIACPEKEEREFKFVSERLRARLLVGLHGAPAQAGQVYETEAGKSPSFKVGAFTFVLHPENQRLIQLRFTARNMEHLEFLSDHQEYKGALLATRRELYIDGEFDLEEKWERIVEDTSPFASPEVAAPGSWAEVRADEQLIAWTELPSLEALSDTLSRLEEEIKESRNIISKSGGFVLSHVSLGLPETLDAVDSWKLALFLEAGPSRQPLSHHSFQVERWTPDARSSLHLEDELLASLPKAYQQFHESIEKEQHPLPENGRLRIWAKFPAKNEAHGRSRYIIMIDESPWTSTPTPKPESSGALSEAEHMAE